MEKGQGKRTDTLQTDNVFTRKEYIEREAALEAVNNADVMCDIHPDAYRVLRRYIERIPAADVAPVVRCKDCSIPFAFSWCGLFPYEGYCFAGVKKDGDGDV